jgi:uncharacterized repeat protein (TIGR01451 family)
MKTLLAAILLALMPGAALAEQVSLTSHVEVIRHKADASGKQTEVLEEPKLVVPGDRLRFTLDYANNSPKPAENFVISDPIPAAVAFAGRESAGADLSVDGGKTFGKLVALSVVDAAGKKRAGLPADVTHVRWVFDRPLAPGTKGKVQFEAIVK